MTNRTTNGYMALSDLAWPVVKCDSMDEFKRFRKSTTELYLSVSKGVSIDKIKELLRSMDGVDGFIIADADAWHELERQLRVVT